MSDARTELGQRAVESFNDLSLMQAMKWTWADLLATPEEVVFLARQKIHLENQKQSEDLKNKNPSVNERRPRNLSPAPPPGMSATLDVPDDALSQHIGPYRRG